VQDKQEQDKMLESVQKLKEMLGDLLEKKVSSAKDLEKKIDSLDSATTEQIRQLQESLKRMQQSQDSRELEKAAEELKEAIKSNTVQDKQEQDKMLESVQRLQDVLSALLGKKELTTAQLKEINKVNEEIKQASEIKQQFLMSEALAGILEKIEKSGSQDTQKAQALKGKLKQMRMSNNSEEIEEIISDLKDISNSEGSSKNANLLEKESNAQSKSQYKIYILPSLLIVPQGVTQPLKVIAVYKKGYVKELVSELDWSTTSRQVAWVDDLNFLHSLTKGKTRISVEYKGVVSNDIEVDVVEDINLQTVQTIKQELE
jgi:myosin heavy subunit